MCAFACVLVHDCGWNGWNVYRDRLLASSPDSQGAGMKTQHSTVVSDEDTTVVVHSTWTKNIPGGEKGGEFYNNSSDNSS